jgi:phage shock protein A
VSRRPEKLDLALTRRLRQVVGGHAASETELRTLADQAAGWTRATEAQLLAAEERLTRLNGNPASPLAEIAAEVRRVEALSRELGEARRLTEGLERRARELRTAWLTQRTESGSPLQPKL